MIKNILHFLGLPLLLVAAFAGTVFAAGEVAGPDGSLPDLLKPIWEAATGHHWWLMASLGLVACVALFKRYAPGKAQVWSHTDFGASILVLAGSFGGALATGLATAGTDAVSFGMVEGALKVAFGAAGGYALLKALVVGPLLGSALWQKIPSAVRTPIELVLRFVFEKSQVAKEAEKAGEAAVIAKPAEGVDGVIGKSTEL